MEYYDLGHNIIAFTTDRTVGRDFKKLYEAFQRDGIYSSASSPSAKVHTGEGDERGFYPHQTHTDKVKQVTKEMLDLSAEDLKAQFEGIDAVISDVKDICLGISTADCIPVLVYDEEHHCAAAIHAGWKGTVKRIVEKAIDAMQESFDTVPSKCRAVIGPGISQHSFEVGYEVVEQFAEAGFNMDDYTVLMPNTKGDGMKPHIDLKAINHYQLTKMGLRQENISVSPIDTFTDARFFSARREQKDTEHKCGRILTGFLLK